MEYEIMLAHGEVDVSIEMGEKSIKCGYGSTDFKQDMFVTMVDSFDEIVLEVSAILKGGVHAEWEFTSGKLFELQYEGEKLEEAKAMADELISNHGFLEAMTESFYR